MKNLREELDPQDLETDCEEARAGRDEADSKGRGDRRRIRRRSWHDLITDPQREDPGEGAGCGRYEIARAHADPCR